MEKPYDFYFKSRQGWLCIDKIIFFYLQRIFGTDVLRKRIKLIILLCHELSGLFLLFRLSTRVASFQATWF